MRAIVHTSTGSRASRGRHPGVATAAAAALSLAAALAVAGCGPEYPNCDNDEDCHEGEFCVNGMCQQCRNDDDCPTGQRCAGGRCEPITGFCQSDGDCPDGQECKDNRCTEVAQSTTDLGDGTGDGGPCQIETVYFDFDSSDLGSTARNTISSNVDCMKERGMDGVHLTGHADPRGTEEYNLALGDRRARSVKKYMTSLGVDGGDVSVSSMGEEMATGTDEASWARDRKVEFQAQ